MNSTLHTPPRMRYDVGDNEQKDGPLVASLGAQGSLTPGPGNPVVSPGTVLPTPGSPQLPPGMLRVEKEAR